MKRKELLAEIKNLSRDELITRGRGVSEELMKLRFRKKTGQLNNSHRLSQLKKELARVKTLLTGMRLNNKQVSAN